LKQDFKMLRDSLEKLHPGLYRYKSKAYMDHVFDSCYATIQDSMAITTFYALTSFVIASFDDGHTNCRLPKQVLSDYLNNTKVFPAMVMFIHNRAYIYCGKQDEVPAESELLSIDGHPMQSIVDRLFKYIPSDGNIQSHKNWEMPEYFQLLYNIVYGGQDEFKVEYKTKEGRVKKAVIQADVLKNFVCSPPFTRPAKYLDLQYKNNVAVLSVKTFFNGFLQQTGENFKSFLDSAFHDIRQKKVDNLLIDVRRNQGGNDENGILLYAYLTQKPFKYYASQESISEKFTEESHSNLGTQQPKEISFGGKAYFLMDGRSFSASAEFIAISKSENRGIFFGEECGGGYYGNTSGDDKTLNLPNSQISCRIPLIKYTSAVKKLSDNHNGVLPDYPVYMTIGDIKEKKDGQLEYTLGVIQGKK
jgi:hypothetical protein